MDVMGAMSDPRLPLTVQEYAEWGNPAVPEQGALMSSYCPYTNIPFGANMPSVYLTSKHNCVNISVLICASKTHIVWGITVD